MIFEFQPSPINILLYAWPALCIGILPAPNDVHYIIEDPPGYLQILWKSPTLDSDELDLQNVSIRRDARIIHYTIFITTEESTIVQVYNASGISFSFEYGSISCGFWFQLAAVNPAGVGERSHRQILTFDCEFHAASCMTWHNSIYRVQGFHNVSFNHRHNHWVIEWIIRWTELYYYQGLIDSYYDASIGIVLLMMRFCMFYTQLVKSQQ